MRLIITAAAFLLDMLFGDPIGSIHPVRMIGLLIKGYERFFYKKNDKRLRYRGIGLVVFVIAVTAIVCGGLIFLSYRISFYLGMALEIILAWSALSAHSLKKESMKVFYALKENDGDLSYAREALSMIVGRDTGKLQKKEIIKATIETIAENTSDGEIAPLFYLAIGGPVLCYIYKAINTMDSMVGYKNERYMDFGCVAARFDDAANFIPSRITGIMTIPAAFILRLNYRNALRIFLRDRRLTASPNAGQVESAFAGALDVSLGGRASYFGRVVEKPTLGDDTRPVEALDITTANRLMYVLAFWIFALIELVLFICEVIL